MSHRGVKHTLFYDEDYVKMSKDAKFLFLLYRLAATNIITLYRPDWDQLRALGGWTDSDLDRLNTELTVKPWVLVERGFVWVIDGVTYEFWGKEPNKKQIVAVANALSDLPKLGLVVSFSQRHKGLIDRIPAEHRLSIGYLYPIVVPHTGYGIPETGNGIRDTCAPGEPSAPPAGNGKPLQDPDEDPKAVLTWFYSLWAEVNGKPWPKSAEGYLKARTNAKRLLKDRPEDVAVSDFLAGLKPAALSALRGEYLAGTPGTLSAFVANRGRYCDTNRKGGGLSVDPKAAELTRRAERCNRTNDGCDGSGTAEACGYCPRTKRGSKQ